MTATRTTKHENMRQSNATSVFEYIRRYGPLTKKQLQDSTQLSWGTVSGITAALLKNNVIYEIKSEDTSIGRKPIELDINPNENLLVGIDANLEGVTGVLIDLKCRVISRLREALKSTDMKDVMEQVEGIIENLINKAGGKDKVLGIGVALPGHVDIEEGVSKYNPQFKGSHNYRISDRLERRFGIQTLIEHDPNCAALTEQMMGRAQNADNFLFVRISVGIGMSLVFNNEIYRGFNGSAGEFGHITVNPDGPRCECGNYGCLETYSSLSAIINRAEHFARRNTGTILTQVYEKTGAITVQDILEASEKGDETARGILHDAAVHLGIAIANVVNILNPDMIVLGGELSRCEEYFVSDVRKTVKLRKWGNTEVNIEVSQFSNEAAAIGAASIFINRILSEEHSLLNNI